jgi:hypothetical protein
MYFRPFFVASEKKNLYQIVETGRVQKTRQVSLATRQSALRYGRAVNCLVTASAAFFGNRTARSNSFVTAQSVQRGPNACCQTALHCTAPSDFAEACLPVCLSQSNKTSQHTADTATSLSSKIQLKT